MKNIICTIFGTLGSTIAYLLGGWDTAIITLLIFMGLDLLTGLIVAGVFHTSTKTKNGALESSTMFKGLCRKFLVLIYVLIAVRIDMVLNTDFVRNAVIIAFIANELLSITENISLTGIPVPKVVINAIEVLKKKEDEQ